MLVSGGPAGGPGGQLPSCRGGWTSHWGHYDKIHHFGLSRPAAGPPAGENLEPPLMYVFH